MRLRDFVWLHTRPPWDRRWDTVGTCAVCRKDARFLYNQWSVPGLAAREMPSDIVAAYRRRESMWCSHCGASQRERELWAVLMSMVEGRSSELRVAEINRLNAGHDRLAALVDVTYSEYPEQDIQALSYPSACFDLVITSDTLEHVRDWRAALRETRRVLKPRGRHIFTVPTRPDLKVTRSRDGMPAIFHGMPPGPLAWLRRGSRDLLLLHDFGADFQEEIEQAGFSVVVVGEGVDRVFVAEAV